MMFIVGISGSPRKKNSERILSYALDKFEKEGHKTEQILLSEKKVEPCIACGGCSKENRCIHDDETNRINETLAKADGILVVTPVYFGSMSGQLKVLLDKTLPLRRNGFLLKGKVGAAIAVGKSRNGGQELACKDIHSWMFIQGMVVVGDNSHFGGTVQSEFEDDEFGKGTVDGVIEALNDYFVKN